jgi:hypothetical protein
MICSTANSKYERHSDIMLVYRCSQYMVVAGGECLFRKLIM